MKKFNRIVVTVKDVQLIYGYSQSSGWRKLQEIKQFFNKPKGACITIDELSVYTTIKKELLEQIIF